MDALGRHILVELYDMPADILDDVHLVEKGMIMAAELAGATIIQHTFHHFSPLGVSGVVVIQESHLAIHTWPEMGYAAVDIFTCGNAVDPWPAYHHLRSAFKASHGSSMELLRGQTSLLGKPTHSNIQAAGSHSTSSNKSVNHSWFTSRDQFLALSLRHKGERLFFHHSPYQKVEVYDTLAYGKMLALDGRIVSTEKDEYIYHEMITHVAMQTVHPAEKVLIIGGGDGGIVKELLRYSQVQSITVVEIDPSIVEASKRFLPEHAQCFEHPKVQLLLEDGIQFVNKLHSISFDVVIVDFVPETLASEQELFHDARRLLSPQGVLIVQTEAPRFTPERFVRIHRQLRSIFGKEQVYPYLAYIPTYPTGTWSFAYCSQGSSHPLHLPKAKAEGEFVQQKHLRYYNDQVHHAAFALPNDLRELWLQSVSEDSV